MPQGIKSASGTFQKTMCKAFENNRGCILPPYYDDVTVKGIGFHDHLLNLRSILGDIRNSGLTLNLLKCSFFESEIKLLGHIVGNGRIQLDPDRINSVVSYPVPKDTKSVRRFIGMAQFCRKFLPRLNVILSPLYELLKKNNFFEWNSDCQLSFDTIKSAMTEAPILQTPSKRDILILETDACNTGLGSCLKFIDKQSGVEHIVSYHSHKFTESEYNWNIVEKECYAVIHSLRNFRHYLTNTKFIIKTDNRIITYLDKKNDIKNSRLLHWALELNDYDYDIVHIPARNNQLSDSLSRINLLSLNFSTVIVADVTLDELIREQENDIELKFVRKYLSNSNDFNLGELGPYKRYRGDLHITNRGCIMWRDKLVIPNVLRNKVLTICHDSPLSGHFAEKRTLEKFSKLYFWPHALKDVRSWVRSCLKCNQFNPPRPGYLRGPLQPIKTDRAFQIVCFDIAGPFFPPSSRGNQYVLIIVDHFSNWTEFVPLKTIDAVSIARALLDNWCCRYGVPERFHSDGASNVNGNVIQELCKLIGTCKSKSSRLHPQGDGQAEAFVKILKNCLINSTSIAFLCLLHSTCMEILLYYNTIYALMDLCIYAFHVHYYNAYYMNIY